MGILAQSEISPSCYDDKYSLSCCFNKTIAEMQDLVQSRIVKKTVKGGTVTMSEGALSWRGDLSRRLARGDCYGWLATM